MICRRTYLALLATGSTAALGRTGRATDQPSPTDQRADSKGQSSDWPMYQYDAANTGYSPDGTVPAGGVEHAWTFERADLSSIDPTVADGVVYLAYGNQDVGGVVSTVDLASGSRRWSVTVGDEFDYVLGAPAVVGDTVYVSLSSGSVRALNTEDGAEQWRRDLGRFQITDSPAVVDGTVFVSADLDGPVSALDAADGTVEWTTALGEHDFASLAVGGGTVYVGTASVTVDAQTGERTITGGRFVALDATDGTPQWEKRSDESGYRPPAVGDGRVFVSESRDDATGTVRSLAADSGNEQWSTELDGFVLSSPTVADGSILVEAGETCYALDAADGTVEWSFDTRASGSKNFRGFTPVVVGDVVCVGGGDEVFGLDAATGDRLWRGALPQADDVEGTPVVSDGTVIIRGETGLHAFVQGDQDGDDRFDTDGQDGIQFGEVLDAISAFNEDGEIGGDPVSFQDVLRVIEAFNSGG